jgi:hypothetical protein
MVWIVGALCLMLFGTEIDLITLSLEMLGYAIVAGIMVLAGIFFLVSFRRQGRYWGGKAALSKARSTANAFTSLAEPLIGLLTKARSSPSPHNASRSSEAHPFVRYLVLETCPSRSGLTLFRTLSALLVLRARPRPASSTAPIRYWECSYVFLH